jgi:hypothetical protein
MADDRDTVLASARYLDKVQNRVPENAGVAPYYERQIKPLLSGADIISTHDEDM